MNNKGITLIALVITIIVLLILAGVSIAMLTGNNGILSKATTAGNESITAEAEEKINLVLNEAYTGILAGDTTIDITNPGPTDGVEFVINPEQISNKKVATVVTVTWTHTTYGTYTGSITYDSGTGDYTIHSAHKS